MVKISCKLKYGLAGSTQRGWSDPAELGFNLLRPKTKRKVFLENTTIHLRENLIFFVISAPRTVKEDQIELRNDGNIHYYGLHKRASLDTPMKVP